MADFVVSHVILIDGRVVELKDAVARGAIMGGSYFLGVTTTNLTDGSTTTPVTISGQEITPENGSMVVKGNKEFIYSSNDHRWHELGDLTGLGDLAVKDYVVAHYTPAGSVQFTGGAVMSSGTFLPHGTISKPNILVNYTPKTVHDVTNPGQVTSGSAASMVAPQWTATVNNETLEFSWEPGSFTPNTPTTVVMPTLKQVDVVGNVTAELANAPVFTGQTETVQVTGMAVGTAQFIGSQATISAS